MAKETDRFPNSRDKQLAMAKIRVVILTAQGAAWGIPELVTAGPAALTGEAGSVPAATMNKSTRTPVVTARCREVFGKLEAMMRDIKERYFFSPPLREADFIALGLRIADSHPSQTGKPEAQIRAEPFLVARHEPGVRIMYVTGSPDDPANKEYRIWYKAVSPGEKAPEYPQELPESFPTRWRRDLMQFEYGASGKTVYMAVQIENGKKKGPWGPLVSAVIP
jgi:hypothetical protein